MALAQRICRSAGRRSRPGSVRCTPTCVDVPAGRRHTGARFGRSARRVRAARWPGPWPHDRCRDQHGGAHPSLPACGPAVARIGAAPAGPRTVSSSHLRLRCGGGRAIPVAVVERHEHDTVADADPARRRDITAGRGGLDGVASGDAQPGCLSSADISTHGWGAAVFSSGARAVLVRVRVGVRHRRMLCAAGPLHTFRSPDIRSYCRCSHTEVLC